MRNLHLGEHVGNSRVWVGLGVEHQSSNSSGKDEERGSSGDDTDGPLGQQGDDVDDSLLISVGEVVVSGGHVSEGSGLVHLENSSVEVLAGSVELSAVSNILFSISFVVSVLVKEILKEDTVLLIEESESQSGLLGLNENLALVSGNPVIRNGSGSMGVFHLNEVRSIGLVSSFSGVSSRVGVTSGPLEVDVISDSGVEVLRDKVVLG